MQNPKKLSSSRWQDTLNATRKLLAKIPRDWPIYQSIDRCSTELERLFRGVPVIRQSGAPASIIDSFVQEAEVALITLYRITYRVAGVVKLAVEQSSIAGKLSAQTQRVDSLTAAAKQARTAMAEIALSDADNRNLDKAALGLNALTQASRDAQVDASAADVPPPKRAVGTGPIILGLVSLFGVVIIVIVVALILMNSNNSAKSQVGTPTAVAALVDTPVPQPTHEATSALPTSTALASSPQPPELPTDTAVPPVPTDTIPLPTETVALNPTSTAPAPTQTLPPSAPQQADTPPDLISTSSLASTVDSAHPYEASTDKTWLIPAADSEAGAVRLHFSRIDVEKDVDWVIIMDVSDNEMQRFTGTYPDGVWTDPVPGSFVKVRLLTDKSVQMSGFSADEVGAVRFTTLSYSPHPYLPQSQQKWLFSNSDPNASGTRIHFSRVDLEDGVDWLVVSGVDGTPYQWITGHHPEGMWTLAVSGGVINVQLVSDATVGDWGFNADQLETAPPDAAQPRPQPDKALAESPHPYTNKTDTTVLTNPDPSAAFSKVHISRLDFYYGQLVLLDGNDNPVQQINGHKRDFWSDDIPGRVVKVRIEGSDYNDWGFRVDQLASGSTKKSLAESKHPYTNETQNWTLVNSDPSAAFSKVHISRLDFYYGQLVLLDGNDNPVQQINGHKRDFWSDDIPGRVVKVRIEGSDYNDWGFRIDQLADGGP